MIEPDPAVTAAVAAHHEGRYADALPLLEQLFARAESDNDDIRSHYFITMFAWQLLLADYPAARSALQAIRDGQIGKLRAGARDFGPVIYQHRQERRSRFSVIVELNDLLQDPASTCALFVTMEATEPALARQASHRVLSAMVAVGNFALAERYRGDPLQCLTECNSLRHTFPLFPPLATAPRLSATLIGLMNDVHIALAVLEGTGRLEEAEALRSALLDGLEDDAMRDLAQRDLDAPGEISRAMAAHRMALESVTPP